MFFPRSEPAAWTASSCVPKLHVLRLDRADALFGLVPVFVRRQPAQRSTSPSHALRRAHQEHEGGVSPYCCAFPAANCDITAFRRRGTADRAGRGGGPAAQCPGTSLKGKIGSWGRCSIFIPTRHRSPIRHCGRCLESHPSAASTTAREQFGTTPARRLSPRTSPTAFDGTGLAESADAPDGRASRGRLTKLRRISTTASPRSAGSRPYHSFAGPRRVPRAPFAKPCTNSSNVLLPRRGQGRVQPRALVKCAPGRRGARCAHHIACSTAASVPVCVWWHHAGIAGAGPRTGQTYRGFASLFHVRCAQISSIICPAFERSGRHPQAARRRSE